MSQLMTIDETAVAIGVSKRTIFAWIRGGRLETIKLAARTVRIRKCEVERFLTVQTRTRPH